MIAAGLFNPAMRRLIFTSASTLLLAGGFLSAEVPNRLHHQGRVAVNGVNYDGTGSFKFLLFTDADANHANGNETAVWKSDDAAPANMNEPVAAVPLLVSKGLYALNLGDTGQAVLPTSLEPAAGRRLYLRIWFDNGINGLQQLTPDQEMAAVPFARHAVSVNGLSSAGGGLSWGLNTQITAPQATAWGEDTLASAMNATAWGDTTEAGGIGATAWGTTTLASGDISTAWGNETKAGGTESTAWGRLTQSMGDLSTAWGRETTAPSYLETALGQFNTNYTRLSSVAWNPADRLFVIGNGTSDTSRSDALVILKNGASSFGGAVSVAGDLNVTGAVNYGSLNLPANVMLEGEGLGLLNNDAGFLASPAGTVEVPENSVSVAAITDVLGKVHDGTSMPVLNQLTGNGKGVITAYSVLDEELLLILCNPNGTAYEDRRLPFPFADGPGHMTFDLSASGVYPGVHPNFAMVLRTDSHVRLLNLRISGGVTIPPSSGNRYWDDSFRPGSIFTRMQTPNRVAMRNPVLAIASSAENAVTVIDMTKTSNEFNLDPTALIATLEASPTLPIYNPVDVVVTSDLVIIAGKGSDTVQLIGYTAGPTITTSVMAKITDGVGGFTRVADPELLAHNGGLVLAISSTVDDAITLAKVSSGSEAEPLAVIEGHAQSMIFKDENTLIVRKGNGIVVLDVTNTSNIREVMNLNTVNTPDLQLGSAGLAMAQPNILASPSADAISLVKLDLPPATQSMTVTGWLGLGVERAYAPLHVSGSVIVEDADTIHLGGTNLTGTAERIALGTNARVVTTGIALGSNALTLRGGTAIGPGTRAEGDFSTAIGSSALANGDKAVALGTGVIANSMGETALGTYNTDHPALSATSFNPADRLLVVGNGWNARSDALVILKNGDTTLNGALTINGGATVTGQLNAGSIQATTWPPEVAQLSTANVFTQDVTTQADYKYATPKTVKRRVHARAFAPAGWFTSREVDFDIDGDFLYLEDTPTQTAKFNAGVDLPAGAVIKKLQIHYMDDQGMGTGGNDNFDATLTLRAFNGLTGGTSGAGIINLNTTGQDPDIKTAEVTVNHTVSANNAYGLHFTMTNCAGNDLRFYGVTIEYETTAVQP